MTFRQQALWSYPLATWLMAFSGAALMSLLTQLPPDWSLVYITLIAPISVPIALLWGSANLVSFGFGFRNDVLWWWLYFVLCWVICFRILGAWERRNRASPP